ncbi:MAG TPA: helix-turn-helix transcriptional regulator [Bryobacteraceae bacterium]|jgi:transcriptional regulator with XRE-family HTH domain|nr:helix-turn-helix transcriptional regulator [Bryobacteraceae bacterium]
MTLPELIRAMRKERGESGTVFGGRLGLRHSMISRYEKGHNVPSLTVLIALHRLSVGTVFESEVGALLPVSLDMPSGPRLTPNDVLAHELKQVAEDCLRFHRRVTDLLARLELAQEGAENNGSFMPAASPEENACTSCGHTLAHFAGPDSGERGLVCQTPGCDMEDVELQDSMSVSGSEPSE